MKSKTITTLTLLASTALLLSACENQQLKPYGKRKASAGPQKPGPQAVDECPEAEGDWSVGQSTIVVSRKEGFLTLSHPDLTEAIVFDGKARAIKQTVGDVSPEITGTCKGKVVNVVHKFTDRSVTQTWIFDLEKDSVVLTENDPKATNPKQVSVGSRIYAKTK